MSFNDNEDYILPEGYNEDDSFDIPDDEDDYEAEFDDYDDDDSPGDESDEDVETIKIRYNHEDLEIPLSEAQELIQKGKNYDKVYSKLQEFEQDRKFVQGLAEENDMSVEEFLEVFYQEKEQAQKEELMEYDIPPEIAEEILEARKERQERQRLQREQEQRQYEEAEFLDFFSEFKSLNGREFVPGQDDLPQEVWEAQAQGIPLRFAYMQFFNKDLQNRLRVLQQNQTNSERSPVGSTTRHGSKDPGREDEFLAGFNSV